VLDGIEMTVRTGEIVGVCGAVGSGKTTLLLCLAGLLRPDAGTIIVRGTSATCLASYVASTAWSPSRLSPSQHLARALASATPILLLDGMLGDLSNGARGLLMELARRGMTILLAERETSGLESLVGRILTIRDGRLHASSPTHHHRARRTSRVAEPNHGPVGS